MWTFFFFFFQCDRLGHIDMWFGQREKIDMYSDMLQKVLLYNDMLQKVLLYKLFISFNMAQSLEGK